ncbi:MAG: 7-carboxy-7-deazaguanine synthase QueE [Bacteroidia bacterium]
MPNTLPVMEAFYTIQGEGYNQGKAAFFIRLGGCDVGCVWCDVKESWPAEAHPQMSVDNLVALSIATKAPNVVITGGEPSMYDLSLLTQALQSHGLNIWIESAGTSPLRGTFDWVCISPKKFKPVLRDNLELADELKVVIYHKSDLKWAQEHAKKVKQNCVLYLQPEWSKEKEILPLIVDFVKAHPEWRISLQTHKYMNIP